MLRFSNGGKEERRGRVIDERELARCRYPRDGLFWFRLTLVLTEDV